MSTCIDARRRQLLALGLHYPQAIAVCAAVADELREENGPVSNIMAGSLDQILYEEAQVASCFELARLAARCLEHRRATRCLAGPARGPWRSQGPQLSA